MGRRYLEQILLENVGRFAALVVYESGRCGLILIVCANTKELLDTWACVKVCN
jgi:hypothetical protein